MADVTRTADAVEENPDTLPLRARLSRDRVLLLDGADAATVGRCPTCGDPILGWAWDQDLEEAFDLVPMWPGGPLAEVRAVTRRQRPVPYSQRLTPECGHTFFLHEHPFYVERTTDGRHD